VTGGRLTQKTEAVSGIVDASLFHFSFGSLSRGAVAPRYSCSWRVSDLLAGL